MENVTGLRCVNCNSSYRVEEIDYFCPGCGHGEGILDVEYDYRAASRQLNSRALFNNGDFSQWRYLPLLPVRKEYIQHLHLGWTPIYQADRLAEYLGVRACWVKDEGRNPTASFKDRASAIGVAKALEKKAEVITCASTGNAASSLAGFAAAAGLTARIFVPLRAPEGKVAQLMIFGAEVMAVDADYDRVWELCMEASAEFGWYNRNCAVNPYLIEGKKTAGMEIAEQFARREMAVPDWVVVSVGDGCTIGGVWKGLVEMHKLGVIERLPKMLGVQSAGCQPFVTAWQGDGRLRPVNGHTVADSISVGHPRNFAKGMQAVVRSGGAFVAVSDDEIMSAMKRLARLVAVFGEPAGAAGVAGARAAVSQGIIDSQESVLVLVTGNGLKDVATAIRAAGKPRTIPPDLQAVRQLAG
ncbi:MAG: threonine synthase [Negativicutes bacterium]|nr:threonine synthase [Negativicutes bacterium]